MDSSTIERKRGNWLAGWLIFIAFLHGWLIYQAALTLASPGQALEPGFSEAPGWAVILLIVLSVVNIGGVVALWRWRKAGLYVFFVTFIPLIIVNVLLGVQLLLALFPLYSLSTLWTLLQPRWKYFY